MALDVLTDLANSQPRMTVPHTFRHPPYDHNSWIVVSSTGRTRRLLRYKGHLGAGSYGIASLVLDETPVPEFGVKTLADLGVMRDEDAAVIKMSGASAEFYNEVGVFVMAHALLTEKRVSPHMTGFRAGFITHSGPPLTGAWAGMYTQAIAAARAMATHQAEAVMGEYLSTLRRLRTPPPTAPPTQSPVEIGCILMDYTNQGTIVRWLEYERGLFQSGVHISNVFADWPDTVLTRYGPVGYGVEPTIVHSCVTQLLYAAAAMKAIGLMHRDLHPPNIMVDSTTREDYQVFMVPDIDPPGIGAPEEEEEEEEEEEKKTEEAAQPERRWVALDPFVLSERVAAEDIAPLVKLIDYGLGSSRFGAVLRTTLSYGDPLLHHTKGDLLSVPTTQMYARAPEQYFLLRTRHAPQRRQLLPVADWDVDFPTARDLPLIDPEDQTAPYWTTFTPADALQELNRLRLEIDQMYHRWRVWGLERPMYTHASDLWSLGVAILFIASGGRHPFRKGEWYYSAPQVFQRHLGVWVGTAERRGERDMADTLWRGFYGRRTVDQTADVLWNIAAALGIDHMHNTASPAIRELSPVYRLLMLYASDARYMPERGRTGWLWTSVAARTLGPDGMDLMREIMSIDPTRRPDASVLLRTHPFFALNRASGLAKVLPQDRVDVVPRESVWRIPHAAALYVGSYANKMRDKLRYMEMARTFPTQLGDYWVRNVDAHLYLTVRVERPLALSAEDAMKLAWYRRRAGLVSP